VSYWISKRESELLHIEEGECATGLREGKVIYWTSRRESELLDIEEGK
jgi:hypothetical protein